MRKASVFVSGVEAGTFIELELGRKYRFEYLSSYSGTPVSHTMHLGQLVYEYDSFPPFFDGVLPEGYQLEGLLKFGKIDRNDLFAQLLAVGEELVGNITIKET
jgi:serine/threonine-protein kinase HipA